MNCRRKYQVGNIFLSPRHHQRQRGSAAAAPHTHLLLTTSLSPLNSPTQDWIKTKQAEFWKDLDDYDYVASRCLFNKIESCCSCSHCVHKKDILMSRIHEGGCLLPLPSVNIPAHLARSKQQGVNFGEKCWSSFDWLVINSLNLSVWIKWKCVTLVSPLDTFENTNHTPNQINFWSAHIGKNILRRLSFDIFLMYV